ncbi:MAG: hypothetical protein IPL40_16375 [Proteobacteria bacterium]|nr:hypothetical protein [Pseudomonadota bacterium]
MNGTMLDELAALGGGAPTAELIERCWRTPALLHTVSECLRSGLPHARLAAARLFLAVAQRRPELAAEFCKDLIETSRQPAPTLAKLGFEGVAALVPAAAAQVFAERDYLLERAQARGTLGLAALKVLAALCAQGPNYRGKLLGPTIRVLQGAPAIDLARWVAALAPGCAGSEDGVKRLQRELAPRIAELEATARVKLERQLLKAARAAPTRKAHGPAAAR